MKCIVVGRESLEVASTYEKQFLQKVLNKAPCGRGGAEIFGHANRFMFRVQIFYALRAVIY